VDFDPTSDTGPLGPGLSELFQTLTSAPAAGELAGEQAALAMFRENRQPAAGRSRQRAGRLPGVSGRWGLRLAAAGTVLLSGGLAAAAYAAVLPAAVQHAAHQVLGFAGVPDAHHHHQHASALPPGTGKTSGPGGQSSSPGAGGRSPSPGASPGAAAHATPTASTAAGSSAPAGPDRLSASAPDSLIAAGTPVTISGHLTTSAGAVVPGARVWLLERPGLAGEWRVAGSALSDSAGNAAVEVPLLGFNAAFRLAGPGGVISPAVLITVQPPVEATLSAGSKGIHDVLTVSTQYARRGNLVVLEVQAADGSWSYLREQTLNAAGKTRFAVNARSLGNDLIRVELAATARHGESASAPVTVPPPAS
jgi:hypothetical protein